MNHSDQVACPFLQLVDSTATATSLPKPEIELQDIAVNLPITGVLNRFNLTPHFPQDGSMIYLFLDNAIAE